MANSGGLELDTAMSIAASNAVIHLRREYLIIGDPMWPDTWGEIPYFLRKSRQNAGIDLNLKCRGALPAPLPARIAELGFAVYGGFFTKDERRVGERTHGEGECPTRRRVPPQLIQSTGVPIVLEQWGEIPYFLRKSRQNVGIELNFKCRDALPTPLPTRIAELSFAVYGRFFTKDERRGAERYYQPFSANQLSGR